MFRSLFRTRRTVRVPVDDGNKYQVQRVKIYKGTLPKPSNLLTYFFFSYFAFRLFESLSSARDGTASDQDRPSATSNDQGLEATLERVHGMGDEAMVIARSADGKESVRSDVLGIVVLPIWFRSKPGAAYQPSDPEFRDFARIQSDPKKMTALGHQVIGALSKRIKAEQHPRALRHINWHGKLETRIDFAPQLRAPPTCESPAIVIFKDGVAFGWKAWKPEIGDRLLRVLRPVATLDAARASLRAFIQATRASATATLQGKELVFDGRRLHLREPGTATDKALPGSEARGLSKMTQTVEQLVAANSSGSQAQKMHDNILSSMPFSTAIQFAAAAFRNVQKANLVAHQQAAARGAIQIRCTARFVGDTGSYNMNFIAIYLPSEDKFLGPLIVTGTYISQDFAHLQAAEDERRRNLVQAPQAHKTSVVRGVEAVEAKSKVDKPGK